MPPKDICTNSYSHSLVSVTYFFEEGERGEQWEDVSQSERGAQLYATRDLSYLYRHRGAHGDKRQQISQELPLKTDAALSFAFLP